MANRTRVWYQMKKAISSQHWSAQIDALRGGGGLMQWECAGEEAQNKWRVINNTAVKWREVCKTLNCPSCAAAKCCPSLGNKHVLTDRSLTLLQKTLHDQTSQESRRQVHLTHTHTIHWSSILNVWLIDLLQHTLGFNYSSDAFICSTDATTPSF